MPHYDRLETRTAASRENALLRDLRAILGMARTRAPALRQQLKHVDIDKIKSRADLIHIPLQRRADFAALQRSGPPLGGTNTTRVALLRALYMDSRGLFIADGHAKDWWGGARAFYAAGFRKGDLILNACSYHLNVEGHMVECGLKSLGAVVIPAGPDTFETQLAMLAACPADGYVGSLAHLNRLIAAGLTFRTAIITGTCLSDQQREDHAGKGIALSQIYMAPEAGIIAYESPENGVLIVNEGLIVEIIDPISSKPLPQGEFGEVVVTRLKTDLPLLRFATGDLAALIDGPNLCGRTNTRLIFPAHPRLNTAHARMASAAPQIAPLYHA